MIGHWKGFYRHLLERLDASENPLGNAWNHLKSPAIGLVRRLSTWWCHRHHSTVRKWCGSLFSDVSAKTLAGTLHDKLSSSNTRPKARWQQTAQHQNGLNTNIKSDVKGRWARQRTQRFWKWRASCTKSHEMLQVKTLKANTAVWAAIGKK